MTPAFTTCAPNVERGDPDRYLAAMAAPVDARAALMVLAATNLELARAPWVTKEALIAQMRLQFWRDVITGDAPAAHDVAGPLQDLIAEAGLSRDLLLGMVDAREAEIDAQAPFSTTEALWTYLEQGAGGLLALSVEALGGPKALAPAIQLGAAQGLANYLRAIPELEAAGKLPLPDGRPEAVRQLAAAGLDRARLARKALRGLERRVRPALLAAWQTEAILKQAVASPDLVGQGGLGQSEFMRRGSLVMRSLWS